MVKQFFEKKVALIRLLLKKKISKQEVAEKLGKALRTVRRYVQKFLEAGPEGLQYRHHGNHRILDEDAIQQIVQTKLDGKHRSARFIRDRLGLKVHRSTVWEVLHKYHLTRISLPPVKPIKRFVAPYPNALWQADIMGKATFCKVLDYFLIAVIDDCSRFLLWGQWFSTQHAIHVFVVLHEALKRYGIPEKILSDRGSQFKSTDPRGSAWWENYLKVLEIEPSYAQKAQTKGKIERWFQFVQRDFVLEYRHLSDLKEINHEFQKYWMTSYNERYLSEALGGDKSPADVYKYSQRRPSKEELLMLLIHEEPRKVRRDGHVSYYGKLYRVPNEFINRRVFVILKGDHIFIESGGEVVAAYPLQI